MYTSYNNIKVLYSARFYRQVTQGICIFAGREVIEVMNSVKLYKGLQEAMAGAF